MAITAAMVKELREKTGSGMMDCKKALEQTGGDMEAAIDELRKKGLATAQKRAGRIAAEGLTAVIVSEDSKTAGVVEVNSETDFVANNDLFRSFVKEVADQALIADTSDIDTFMNSKWHLDETKTVNDALVDKISVIRENLKIRRVQMLKSDCYVGSYVHGGGRISVLVAAKSDVVNDEFKEAVKNVAMQVCSMKPEYKSEADIPQEVLGILKNHLHILPKLFPDRIVHFPGNILPFENNAAAGRIVKADNAPSDGRFAGSAFTDQPVCLARINPEGDTVHRSDRKASGDVKMLHQLFHH